MIKKTTRNTEITDLKILLSNNKIELSEAIDKFISLLNSYEHNSNNVQDEETIFYRNTWSKISKDLYKENERLKDRTNNLNRIIVLIELGMRFSEEELNQILSKE